MILFYFVLFFLFIFGPVFNTIGSWADIIFFLSLFLAFVHIVIQKKFIPKYVTIFSILIPLSILTCLTALFYPKITQSDLVQIVLKPIRILTTLIGGFCLIYTIFHKYPKKYLLLILKLIFFSIVLNGIIMILQFHNPEFKEFIYSYTFTGEIRSTFDYDFRMGGLSGATGGAVLSVVQSVGIVISPFFFKTLPNKFLKYFYVLCAFSIFYSILICGRSGIWSTFIFTLVSYFFIDSSSFFIKSIKFLRILLFVFLFVMALLFYIEKMEDNNPIFFALNRSLDTFLNFKESGNFEDNTVNTLGGHIQLPTDLKTFFLGDTEAIVNTQFDRKLDSDIGYIRNVWGLGIFGTIIYILPMLVFIRLSYKYFSSSNSSKLLLLLSIITCVFHAKEVFIYTRMLFSVYSLILALFYLEVYSKKKLCIDV